LHAEAFTFPMTLLYAYLRILEPRLLSLGVAMFNAVFSLQSRISLQSQAHSCHIILIISHYCHSHTNNYCTVINIQIQ